MQDDTLGKITYDDYTAIATERTITSDDKGTSQVRRLYFFSEICHVSNYSNRKDFDTQEELMAHFINYVSQLQKVAICAKAQG